MMKKRGLGKGLEALLGASQAVDVLEDHDGETAFPSSQKSTQELDVQKLQPSSFQPRQKIDPASVQELADSIRTQGIIQPIIVRKKKGSDYYEILAGERRFRAAELIGLAKVPVVVVDVPDEKAMVIALIENIQREDLSPLEEALALERLSKEFDLTHQQVADAVGKSRTTVTNLLRLLSLSEDVKHLLREGKLEAGHAKVLLSLKGSAQSQAAHNIVTKKLSVRESEQLVARLLEGDTGKTQKQPASKDPDVRRLENKLSEQLGAYVQIVHNREGKGRLVIPFSNLMELDGILEHILNEV